MTELTGKEKKKKKIVMIYEHTEQILTGFSLKSDENEHQKSFGLLNGQNDGLRERGYVSKMSK